MGQLLRFVLHDFFDENVGPENHLDQQDSNLDSTHKHITIINVTNRNQQLDLYGETLSNLLQVRKSCTVKLQARKLNFTFMQSNIRVYFVSFNLIGHLNVELTYSSLKIQVKEEVFLELCLIDGIDMSD